MRITIESTDKIVELNGVPARLWQGQTESGVKVHAYITRIAHDINEPSYRVADFKQELEQHTAPRAEIAAIPLRMVL